MIDIRLQRHGMLALLAAALFGASTPLAKQLLADTGPFTLAGLLYLGAAAGLLALRLAGRGGGAGAEARLKAADLPWLAAAVASGGVLAPVLLLWGLRETPASVASLLLSFEAAVTALIAAGAFREAVGARVWAGAAVMLAAAALLGYQPPLHFPAASLAIVAACVLWAIDNNLTRRISAADPAAIAVIKGAVAGAVNLGLGFLYGASMPGGLTLIGALALGAVSYGVSLVLYIGALRHLGSARAAAHFGAAPFFGALLAVLMGDRITPALIAAFLLMALAAWMLLSEHHEHRHIHAGMVHDHLHVHDEHHRHRHEGPATAEPHAHVHVHEPHAHSHPHLPDLHHRHGH